MTDGTKQMESRAIPTYIDFKSPYAYLAITQIRGMAIEYELNMDWRPYNLPIADYLGAVDTRNEHQWRRVKYSYMDCRRLANQRGLTILGPQKLYDSTTASIGLLFAKQTGCADAYIDQVFKRFFRRQLNIEDPEAVALILEKCGASGTKFLDYHTSEGVLAFNTLVSEAHKSGIFGVPSFLLDGELFWGTERMELMKEKLRNRHLAEGRA